MPKSDLLEKQASLQAQAAEVLKRLDLLKLISRYGRATVVGSVALVLMTWPDIDIDLKSKAGINNHDYFEIIKKIFAQKDVRKLTLIDNRASLEKNRPPSFYIGLVYDLDGVSWKIDIRYMNSADDWAEQYIDKIKSRLTAAKIASILEIKTAFHSHPLYGREIHGHMIYEAVLDQGISTLKEFKKYLGSIGIKF